MLYVGSYSSQLHVASRHHSFSRYDTCNTRNLSSLLEMRLLFIILVGILNGFKDTSSENRFLRPYWNKGKGWKFKWKRDENDRLIPQTKKLWYYLWVFTPKVKEQFPYSSTLLVWLTDGWHLLQSFQFRCAWLAVYLPTTPTELIFSQVVAPAIFSLGFHISYSGYKAYRRMGTKKKGDHMASLYLFKTS